MTDMVNITIDGLPVEVARGLREVPISLCERRKSKTPPVIRTLVNGKRFRDFLKKSEAPEWAESVQMIRTP